MKKKVISLILVGLLTLAFVGNVFADASNPGVFPKEGQKYGQLGAKWWKWAYSFPAADVPFLNPGGPVDISAGQKSAVWFLAGASFTLGPVTRTGEVPADKFLFFPLVNLVNDYPCPPEYGFEPPPGETLKHFLQRTGNEFLDGYVPDPSTLFAEIDGVSLTNLSSYRANSNLFKFTADPALVTIDPCITGTRQPGVAVGYWLLLKPLTPGVHTLHFGAPSAGQDITYILTVTPSNDD